MRKIKTACPLDCWDTCSIIAEVEDGKVVRLDGDPNHPVTQGFLCGKGRKLKDRLYSEHRILHPMKRVGGKWQTIGWEAALDEIATKLCDTLATSGHQAILHAYDWGSGTVLKNLNQRFFNLLGGCTETVGSLCWDAGLEAQRYDFGQSRSHSPEDTAKAQGIVVWGRNLATTNIHMVPFVRQAVANGAALVVINPLSTDLDLRADLRIEPRPGTDAVLAFGVLKYCMDQGWLDEEFLDEHSLGWPELANSLQMYNLATVTRITDVPEDKVIALANLYGQVRPVTTLLGIGLQRYPGGGNTVRAIDALAAATGHIGIQGGGVNYANRAIPAYLNQAGLAGTPTNRVREFTRGEQAEQILAADPAIEVLFVTRTNTVAQVPNSKRLIEAYETIPTRVVIDQFLTPTAELADYFLPCTSVLEDEDFVFSTMWQPNVTYIKPAVKPLGEVKPDWEIFALLAERLGLEGYMDCGIHEWMDLALAPMHKHGVTLKTLQEQGTVTLPTPDVPWEDGHFLTPSGKFEFASSVAQREGHSRVATYIPTREIVGSGSEDAKTTSYPFALLTIHPRLSENSQHKDLPELPLLPTVEISRELAMEQGLVEGDEARLWNDQAELTVRVRVVATSHPKTIKLESGWWGQGLTVNHLTKSHLADFGQQTAQYDCACNLQKQRTKQDGVSSGNFSEENLSEENLSDGNKKALAGSKK